MAARRGDYGVFFFILFYFSYFIDSNVLTFNISLLHYLPYEGQRGELAEAACFTFLHTLLRFILLGTKWWPSEANTWRVF